MPTGMRLLRRRASTRLNRAKAEYPYSGFIDEHLRVTWTIMQLVNAGTSLRPQ